MQSGLYINAFYQPPTSVTSDAKKKKLFPYSLLFSVAFCNFSTLKELLVVSRKSKYEKRQSKVHSCSTMVQRRKHQKRKKRLKR